MSRRYPIYNILASKGIIGPSIGDTGSKVGDSSPSVTARFAASNGVLYDNGKFKCPPGTPGAGDFTDPTGSTCNTPSKSDDVNTELKVGAFGSHSRSTQLLQGIASTVTPGDMSDIRSPVRSTVYEALTPGGGRNRRLPGRIGRGQDRCPPGFENGGRFTNNRFTNCGARLFDLPSAIGTRRVLQDTDRALTGDAKKPGEGRLIGRISNTPSIVVRRNAEIPVVGSRNDSAADSAAQSAIPRIATDAKKPVVLIRRDGTTLHAAVSASRLTQTRNNADMADGIIIRSVTDPNKLGDDDIGLLAAGARKSVIVFPDSSTLTIQRTPNTTPGQISGLKRRWSSLRRNQQEMSYGSALEKLVEDSNGKLKLIPEINNVKNPLEMIEIVRDDGSKRMVRRWIYEMFLAPSAPSRPDSVEPWQVAKETKSHSPLVASFPAVTEKQIGIDFKANRYASSKIAAEVSYQVKAGRIQPEKIIMSGGTRATRFRCPVGTNRAGEWTNSMGTTCNIGPARQTLGEIADAINPTEGGRRQSSVSRPALGAAGGGGTKPPSRRRVMGGDSPEPDGPTSGNLPQRSNRVSLSQTDVIDKPSGPSRARRASSAMARQRAALSNMRRQGKGRQFGDSFAQKATAGKEARRAVNETGLPAFVVRVPNGGKRPFIVVDANRLGEISEDHQVVGFVDVGGERRFRRIDDSVGETPMETWQRIVDGLPPRKNPRPQRQRRPRQRAEIIRNRENRIPTISSMDPDRRAELNRAATPEREALMNRSFTFRDGSVSRDEIIAEMQDLERQWERLKERRQQELEKWRNGDDDAAYNYDVLSGDMAVISNITDALEREVRIGNYQEKPIVQGREGKFPEVVFDSPEYRYQQTFQSWYPSNLEQRMQALVGSGSSEEFAAITKEIDDLYDELEARKTAAVVAWRQGDDESRYEYSAYVGLQDVLAARKIESENFRQIAAERERIERLNVRQYGPKDSKVGPMRYPEKPGRYDQDFGTELVEGYSVPKSVPVGNMGINTVDQAIEHVATGGSLDDVPDLYLHDAIIRNFPRLSQGLPPGGQWRFQSISIAQGINEVHQQDARLKTWGLVDTVTGKKYIVKAPTNFNQETDAEVATMMIGQLLGLPMPRVRFASDEVLNNENYPLVMEHVDDVIDAPVRENGMDIPDGVYSGAYIGGDEQMAEVNDFSVAATMLLDTIVQNYDRHGDNWIWAHNGDSTVIPIDNGAGLDYIPDAAFVERSIAQALPMIERVMNNYNPRSYQELIDHLKGVDISAARKALERYQEWARGSISRSSRDYVKGFEATINALEAWQAGQS